MKRRGGRLVQSEAAPGAALWLFWQGTTLGTAQDVAIDNLSFTAAAAVTGPGAPATLSGFVRNNSNGNVNFSITGQSGFGYIVQTTTNLANPNSWQDLATNIVGSVPWNYSDPSAGGYPMRFYRVKSQ